MNEVILQTISPHHFSMTCYFCGHNFNYIYVGGTTVAFCPNSAEENINKVIDSIKSEGFKERVDVCCKLK